MPPPTSLKPIQTEAFGRLFRSRLEARCAVFLDAMGLQWEYEPEGYKLFSGLYLPDFKVYDSKLDAGFFWVECKGGQPSVKEIALANELSRTTDATFIFYSHQLMEEIRNAYLQLKKMFPGQIHEFKYDCSGSEFGGVPVMYFGRTFWLLAQKCGIYEVDLKPFLPVFCLEKSFYAVNSALKARFEHGEKWA